MQAKNAPRINLMTTNMKQLSLPLSTGGNDIHQDIKKKRSNGQANKIDNGDRAIHDWYRFVLSYPPHLVRDYISDFGLNSTHAILDPFCGTGTTLVEAKKKGIPSIGLEANPFAHFASSVKVDWEINEDNFYECSKEIADSALGVLRAQGIEDFSPSNIPLDRIPLRTLDTEANKLLITNSISPLPLHKSLVLLDCINEHRTTPYYQHMLLAFANALVYKISNLHFGPEVGVGNLKNDYPVVHTWLNEIEKIVGDLKSISEKSGVQSEVYLADSRQISKLIPPDSVDAIITSPPYPNEKDYTRTTRLESVVLGFIRNKADLQQLKKNLIRSNTRGVYKEDDDDNWVDDIPEIQRISRLIEQRRIELGKDSGFEKLYGRVTKLYFGGMTRHFTDLRLVLRKNAQLAYVVGDQASYLRVMIRTGELLAEIAQNLGYELVRIDLFRTRFATASHEQLREEVVVLRWPGKDNL
jgi:DNA modification methylase